IAKHFILRAIDRIVERTPWQWDDVLRDNRVFQRLSHLAPAAVINLLGKGLFAGNYWATNALGAVVTVYVISVLLLVISAVINSLQHYFENTAGNEGVPVKG
ncbi:hypothetical protein RZS08_59630, partial [Arthrospira platensis SPKY1]|nr:hypothetical protein [Arthrospira platensis SPKY1]